MKRPAESIRPTPQASLSALQALATGVASVEGRDAAAAIVRLLAHGLGARFVLALASVESGAPLQPLACELDGRPCSSLGMIGDAPPEGEEAFVWRETGATPELACWSGLPRELSSLARCPIFDALGRRIGVLVVAHESPLAGGDAAHVEAMLAVAAARLAVGPAVARAAEDAERSYRAIFDAAEDAILILDWRTGGIRDANRKACDTYGYSHDELVQLSCADLSSPEANYSLEKMMPFFLAAQQGQGAPFEWHRRNKDGSLHWDEIRLKSVALGGTKFVLSFAREITDRKRALEELQVREEQYRMIFESSSDALFLWDSDLRMVDVNPAALEMYRYTREQVIGRSYPRGAPPEYVQGRLELLGAAVGGQRRHIETQALRSDGTWFEADVRAIPFLHRGRPHALAVIRDISERRARERELQRSEARLRATVEAAFDCVIAMDQHGRVIEFNIAAERVFGYARDEVVGGMLSDFILPERFRGAHLRGLAHFNPARGGPMVGRLVETTGLHKNGTEFPVELAISVAEVSDGNIFVGHLRDISARRAAELERSALESQLRQAQKMEAIGQLTGGIAHDFNNILTSVMGYVVLGQERADMLGDPPLVRQLGQAHLAAQRARDLIAQMLAFARRQKSDPRPLALTPLARQTLRLLRSTLPSTIELDAQWLDADENGEDAWVLADPVQVEQILFNLCINARDAMEGSGRITVRLGRHMAGNTWHCASCRQSIGTGPWTALSVADTGVGIDASLRDRIFDPFFSTKAPGKGSGMGLAMVHGIVHDYGGHILVEEPPTGGAAFTVLLPPAAPGGGAASANVPDRVGVSRLRGRVLLVEDDLTVGDYLREQLDAWGLAVTLARDPVRALEVIADAAQSIDLVLTDLTMPQMTGLELARQAHALRPALPLLLYTGDARAIPPAELEDTGVRAVLRKPVDAAALRSAIRELLTQPA
jgi:PAS domain S-box-containing protein